MKIYTRTGDGGETSLFNGVRVSKADMLIDLLGDSDELNAHLGVVYDLLDNQHSQEQIRQIIDQLFKLNAAIAKSPRYLNLDLTVVVSQLELWIDEMDATLPVLTNFIYQFGHLAVSQIHVARTISRRVERKLVVIAGIEPIDSSFIRYMNRLSDYLFILARYVAKLFGVEEKIIIS